MISICVSRKSLQGIKNHSCQDLYTQYLFVTQKMPLLVMYDIVNNSMIHFLMCFTLSLLLLIYGLSPQEFGHSRKLEVLVFLLHISIKINLMLHGVVCCFKDIISCHPLCEAFYKTSSSVTTQTSSKKPCRNIVCSCPHHNLPSKVISHSNNNLAMASIEVKVWLGISLFIKQVA